MFELNGIAGASPIAFMAALGMLRVLSVDRNMKVRLGWKDGHAIIEGAERELIRGICCVISFHQVELC